MTITIPYAETEALLAGWRKSPPCPAAPAEAVGKDHDHPARRDGPATGRLAAISAEPRSRVTSSAPRKGAQIDSLEVCYTET